jgi:hypothetical protein
MLHTYSAELADFVAAVRGEEGIGADERSAVAVIAAHDHGLAPPQVTPKVSEPAT